MIEQGGTDRLPVVGSEGVIRLLGSLLDSIRAIVARGPTVEDRRMELRAECDLPVFCMQNGSTQEGRVLDLSMQGLRIVTSVPMSTQVPLEVRCDHGGGPVSGRVRWCMRRAPSFHNGIMVPSSLENTWMKPILVRLGLGGSVPRQRRKFVRSPARVPVRLVGRAHRVWGAGYTVDLGMGGCLLRIPAEVKPQTTVAVELGPFGRLKPLKLVGRILSVRESEGGFLHRVEFRELSREQVGPLGTYVLHSLKK
ncbi:MAG: PilZ domain-containing protein [Armatimonadetes bacterium]|nr:PilZ domain-containing protein [Armatimonadota bacterium]